MKIRPDKIECRDHYSGDLCSNLCQIGILKVKLKIPLKKNVFPPPPRPKFKVDFKKGRRTLCVLRTVLRRASMSIDCRHDVTDAAMQYLPRPSEIPLTTEHFQRKLFKERKCFLVTFSVFSRFIKY